MFFHALFHERGSFGSANLQGVNDPLGSVAFNFFGLFDPIRKITHESLKSKKCESAYQKICHSGGWL